MKFLTAIACLVLLSACKQHASLPYAGLDDKLIHATTDTVIKERIYLNWDSTLSFHNVRLNQDGAILPWFSTDLGESYDRVINLVWGFWDRMPLDSNGIKYYMNHQVWRPADDKRGLGGDQVMMALSSWDLLYNYNGNKAVVENMKYMADYYLGHSLSGPNDTWPNLPYPYNTVLHSGFYDGDMILGKGFLQPDKAGSFGFELVNLYKKTGDQKYLDAAVKIANTLAAKVQPGDEFHSPWPFKVNATTGEVGKLINKPNINKPEPGTTFKDVQESIYATNWTATLALFNALKSLGKGDAAAYTKAHDTTLEWLKKYPAKNNKWGPFFEDILGWSDCQINAITYAMYLMENESVDPDWKNTVKGIFHWVRTSLDDKEFAKYGVITTDEQTIYRTPGNSHSSRQASMELRYWEKTGDTTRLTNAIRQLNWATYMVNTDGRNYYIRDDVWLTDGYGDFIRHYIRAMAAAPQLACAKGDHMLRTSSVVNVIKYTGATISYTTFDAVSKERFHLQAKPKTVLVDGVALKETGNDQELGFVWQTIGKNGAGVLNINKVGREVKLSK